MLNKELRSLLDTYKDCVKALYYIMSIEKAMQ